MDTLLQLSAQYGPFGLIILAAFWYIIYKDKEHLNERKELTATLARQHSESLEVTKNNTTVLTEIATLIRNKSY